MTFKIYTFRLGIAFLVILSFQDFANGVDRQNIYKTVDIEDQCDDPYHTYVYILGNTNMSSTLKLRAYKKLGLFYSLYCHFNIRPPIGHEVVIYLEEMDLSYVFTSSKCSYAYLEIKGDNFMTRKVCTQNDQGSSFYLGKEAHLYYYGNFVKRGFTLVATAYTKGCLNTNQTFKCANGNCIWFGLVKDGVNNCGDNSDEVTIVPTRQPITKIPVWEKSGRSSSSIDITVIVIPSVVIIVIIIILIVVQNRIKAMRNRQSAANTSNGQSRSGRQAGWRPRLSLATSVVAAARTNSTSRSTSEDSPPPRYSIVVKDDAKNPPFAPPPPSYSSATSPDFRSAITARMSLPPISEHESSRTNVSNLKSDDTPAPSAPDDWI